MAAEDKPYYTCYCRDTDLSLLIEKINNLESNLMGFIKENENSYLDALLLTSLYDVFDIDVGLCSCFKCINFLYIGHLIQVSEAFLIKIPNLGKKRLTFIKDFLNENKLSLDTNLDILKIHSTVYKILKIRDIK